MSCTPDMQFPGAWPVSASPSLRAASHPPFPQAMDRPGDSPQELHALPCLSCAGGPAIRLAKKPGPLRIVVPPTEYCPFSTDLTLPITPLSLPTPVSSSCFTFTDRQDLASQCPAPAQALSSCSPQQAPVTHIGSPASSQFLLMPPTSHTEGGDSVSAIRVAPFVTPATANESMHSKSNETASGNLSPRKDSSSTWLSDLGGRTQTDRVFRRCLPDVASVGTDNGPTSTRALSQSTVSPSSRVSSLFAHHLPSSLAKSPASSSSSSPLSPYPSSMPSQASSPARLALKPTGTDTFPSTLDSLQAWRQSVTPGIPRSDGPSSPLSDDVRSSRLDELVSEASVDPSLPPHEPHSYRPSPVVPHVSKSQTLMKRARVLGGRVKQLVTRQRVNKHRGSMDRGVDFRVITSPDSENGSVILITAPPPPYDVHSLTLAPHCPMALEHVRSRTASEYSQLQESMGEADTAGMIGSGSRRGGGNRNTLRRLSLAALSTMKRL